MYPPHLPQCAPDSYRALFCLANSPAHHGLLCGFCSSGRDFAAGFLQIPSRDGHPCLWLTLLTVKRVADLHRRVSARAGRTKKTPTAENHSQRRSYNRIDCKKKGQTPNWLLAAAKVETLREYTNFFSKNTLLSIAAAI